MLGVLRTAFRATFTDRVTLARRRNRVRKSEGTRNAPPKFLAARTGVPNTSTDWLMRQSWDPKSPDFIESGYRLRSEHPVVNSLHIAGYFLT